ncbi:hypothetical protein D3C72_2275040 [compost metagenome]
MVNSKKYLGAPDLRLMAVRYSVLYTAMPAAGLYGAPNGTDTLRVMANISAIPSRSVFGGGNRCRK